jgi:5-methylcytosine-specific restriction protein A
MPRNPTWTRDELILALDLYFRVNPLHTSERNPEIQALSRLLNELPVHGERVDEQRFRNPNGVYMKLCNFLRFDPDYHGSGLTRGGRLEQEVWDEFSSRRTGLAATAAAIREARETLTAPQVQAEVPTDDESCVEGALLTALHKRRERSAALTKRKKQAVLEATGNLACEVCGFDFERRYGPIGEGFAECHHTVPLFLLAQRTATRLQDLAILCSNCHRIIHRSKPMLTLQELKAGLRG